MDLAHAQTLVEARSHIAALADNAGSGEASSAYELVLIELDRIHGDESPALCTDNLTTSRNVLFAVAISAVEQLQGYGLDALDIELLLARLNEAHDLDHP
jgi:hypothetical protein